MRTWRYIEENNVSASYGLAADEYLMRGHEAGGGIRPPTLRLYTYRSHCALVGHFQHVEAEIDVRYCRGAAISINRRPTGGGAILMGSDQLGMAFVTHRKYPGMPEHPRRMYAYYSKGILEGLMALGIEGSIEGRNDLQVNGRKIAGLGLCQGDEEGLLFHASLLVGLDIPLMLRVLKIPEEKQRDKVHREVEKNLTTVRAEVGRPLPVAEVRRLIRRGFERSMGVTFSLKPFTPKEKKRIQALEEEKYLNDHWVFQHRPVQSMTGSSLQKTRGGLLRIYVSLNKDEIENVKITGDFFADRLSLKRLEGMLSHIPAEEIEIRKAIAPCFENKAGPLQQIDAEDLAHSILAAVREAGRNSGGRRPYGCFVDAAERR